ncbi:MAG: CopG family transcriptional regulator [Pacificimonas sp.]|jgi:hypothetical protein|nr:CopG family transcriptional regulator [Pacificimonas sp.]
MKILSNIPDDDVAWLDKQAKARGTSRAALLREAVAEYRADARKADVDAIRSIFGIWKDRDDIGDGVEEQRRMRAEWTRPWDDDYEEVRAEFPDLFDEEDDRQRDIYKSLSNTRSTPTS